MDKFSSQRNRDQRALAPAANCNHAVPIRWGASLEEATTREKMGYVGALAELASALACYADTREDRRDMQGAAALLFDARNRMQRRADVGSAA